MTGKKRSTIGAALAALAVLFITGIALASSTVILSISSPAGAAASFTFAKGLSCTGSDTWYFPDPATDATLTNTCAAGSYPGCSSGNFDQSSTQSWSDSLTVTVGGALMCSVTLTPTTTSNTTGSFDTTTKVLTWNPDFTFVASGGSLCLTGSFSCDSSNIVSPVIGGTLTPSGSDFSGIVGVTTSATTAPGFTSSASCPAAAAAQLNCVLGDLTGVYLLATIAP
jgi:hypothetical protein